MNIAYLTNAPIPNTDAVSEQVINNLSALHECQSNISFTLIALPFSKKNISDKQICEFYGITHPVSIRFLPIPLFLGRKNIKKIYTFVAPLYCILHKYDFIYTRHPTILFWSLLFCKKTIFETYRIDINTKFKFALWRGFVYKNKKLLGIITHSNIAKNAFIEKKFHADKIIVAYNAYTPVKVDEKKVQNIKEKFNIGSNEFLVAYAGRVGTKAKRTDIMLQLARAFPDIKFLIIGAGKKPEDDQDFDAMIFEMKLKNVIRTGWVEPSQVPVYLRAANILIIPPSSDPLRNHGKTVLPMKTFLYMAAGKPIIAPDLPDIREILTDRINAILIDPDNFDDFLFKFKNLISNTDLQNLISRNCMVDILEYTWRKRAEKIISFILKSQENYL